MVSLKEWLDAPDNTMFEEKNTKNRISKANLKTNLAQVEKKMMYDYAMNGELPTTENVHRIQDLIAATLENFEIVDITKKETERGVSIEDKPHGHIPSKDKKGEFCYKCGLQKEDTQIVEKEGSVIRMCKECLGIE